MTSLKDELKQFVVLYGDSIPPIPRRPQAVWGPKFQWKMDLDRFAQRVANNPEYKYEGDMGALIRHAVSLYLWALAQTEGEDVSSIRFEMESLRRKAEDEAYISYADYAQVVIKEAGEHAMVVTGKRLAADALWGLVTLIKRHPSGTLRPRMQACLTGNGRFVKLVKDLRDERLMSWLEVAT